MTAVTELAVPSMVEVENMWLKSFTKPSSRSLQSKLGPSEVGACTYCVGYTMAAKLCEMPPREADPFGYAAWLGTACHYYLENKLDLAYGAGYDIESHREAKLKNIFSIEGYGAVGGSCDLYVPDWARTFDYKFPGKYSYDKVKLAIAKHHAAKRAGDLELAAKLGPSMQYRTQQQIYAQGFIQQGLPVTSSVIIFLPRHTNEVSDVLFWEEPVSTEFFQKAIDRTELIWMYVQDGQLGDLPSDPDCYTCSRHGFGDLTNYTQATN